MEIEIKLTIKEVDYWGLDWNVPEDRKKELELLQRDLKLQLEKMGLDYNNIKIDSIKLKEK